MRYERRELGLQDPLGADDQIFKVEKKTHSDVLKVFPGLIVLSFKTFRGVCACVYLSIMCNTHNAVTR